MHDKKVFGNAKTIITFAAHKKKLKTITMKKLLAVLAIAGFIASCNNGAEAPATPNADSIKMADSTAAAAAAAATTATQALDSTKKVADSSIKAVTDTAKKVVKEMKEKVEEKAKDVKEAVKH